MRDKFIWFLLAMLVVPAVPLAQSNIQQRPTQVEILVLPLTGDPATVAPVRSAITTIATVVNGVTTPNANCNFAPMVGPVPPSVTNPQFVVFDDPFNAGRLCRATMPTNVPDGTYRGVAVAIAPSCQPVAGGPTQTPCPGPRSAPGAPNFSIASSTNPPAVLTGVVFQP